DARTYDVAAAILKEIGVGSIELLTNNPEKVESLARLGVEVERRVPVLVAANPFSAGYLEVKRRRMQHDLPIVASTEAKNERTAAESEAPKSRNGRAAGY
ncbi:MAG TPA: hypothetical protein VFQ35_18070, partial [Polyangiaceae bacterium]|nr:hypothetical protein [Polyangiaceae bacterium]